ncbi:MAG: hypothetical protein AAFR17_12440, partial [Pseudomonadota bacterium]
MTETIDFDKLREETQQQLPEALADIVSLPDVLLPYQQELMRTTAVYQLVVCEKSRRIGMTWGVGADAVLTSAAGRSSGGMDTLYIGFNLDMAREFIDVCAMWARAFMPAASAVEETVFLDQDENGDDKAIKAFRITFASGFEIMALTSKPRSLRGRQGYVIFDEAAFHDQLDEMLKAAMALTMWGGKVLVISTHNGVENPFNELIQKIREGQRDGAVLRVDFDQAVAEGLYERIALVKGLKDTAEAKAGWIEKTFGYYGEDADEELRCIPKAGSGVYLSRAAIEACMTEAHVVARLTCPPGFELRPMAERTKFVKDFLDEYVLPHLARLDPRRPAGIGEDFGRTSDLTVISVGFERLDLSIVVPLIVELKNCPLEQQRQVLRAIRAGITLFGGAKFDATGNGLGLAEDMQEEWGHELVEAVKISTGWYLENMPTMKGHIDDQTIELPQDALIRDDLRSLRLVRGVPSIPDTRNKGRHGDAAVSLAMLIAALKTDYQPFAYRPVTRPATVAADDDRQIKVTAG